MEFPTREPDIVRLAHDIAAGLRTSTGLSPAPPFTADQMDQAVTGYFDKRDAVVARTAVARQGTAEKSEALEGLVEQCRANLRYAEGLFRKDGQKLHLVGWGTRSRRTRRELPGQPGNLEIAGEGRTWVSLVWRDPVDGGPATAYKIQRRKTGGEWMDVGTAVESEVTLNNQETGVELEYQVIAVNKTGDGPASNVVRAVL